MSTALLVEFPTNQQSQDVPDLIIDNDIKSVIPPLTEEEKTGLETSIIQEGIRDPIVTWNNIIVDGYSRYEICNEKNIQYEILEKEFDDKTSAIIWRIQTHLNRRNLTTYQKSLFGIKLADFLKPQAKENQKQSQGRGKKGLQKSENLFKPIDTTKLAAESVGVSKDTISKSKKIPHIKLGGKVLFDLEDLMEWIENSKVRGINKEDN